MRTLVPLVAGSVCGGVMLGVIAFFGSDAPELTLKQRYAANRPTVEFARLPVEPKRETAIARLLPARAEAVDQTRRLARGEAGVQPNATLELRRDLPSAQQGEPVAEPPMPAATNADPVPQQPPPLPLHSTPETPFSGPAHAPVKAARLLPIPLRRPPVPARGAPRPALTPPAKARALPLIAVIIDDMGMDRINTARALRLPAPVTMSYLPYAPDIREQTRGVERAGHRLMLHLPMEAPVALGQAPGILKVTQENGTLLAMLDRMLDSFDGYRGVNNHMGSRFTADRQRMRLVLEELNRRGLYFVDSRTSSQSQGPAAARDVGIAYAVRDVFLDHDPSPAAIRRRIADAERIARTEGSAIVIGHPRTTTMEVIEPWLAEIERRGFVLVPVEKLLHQPARKRLASNLITE